MALQGIDGCDHYSDYNDIDRKYVMDRASTFLVLPTGGRFGGYAISANNSAAWFEMPISGLPKTIYWAGAVKEKGPLSYSHSFLSFVSASGIQASLQVTTGGYVRAYRSTGTFLGQSTSPMLSYNIWKFVEIKVVISNTVGIFEIRSDGNVVMNLTLQDTETWDEGLYAMRLQPGDSNGGFVFDDFFWYDTTGSGVNDFTGDRRIDTLRPNGDGGTTQFTKSGGAANYEMVDDTPDADDDATYNESGTVGFKDRLDLGALAATPLTIDAVQATTVSRKTGAGAVSQKVGVYSGSTEGLSAAVGMSTDYEFHNHILELNPDDSLAWEAADIAALQLQYEHA